MPIKTQGDLPVKEILERENIFVMDEKRAMHQDIRPIHILILNLMPLKEETELQLLRSLSNTPLQVDVTFVRVSGHVSKNTSTSHINKFYQSFDEIKNRRFDGFIITGAPVEQCRLKKWIIGMSLRRSWIGQRRTYLRHCICAGELRRVFIIILVLIKYRWIISCLVCSSIRC